MARFILMIKYARYQLTTISDFLLNSDTLKHIVLSHIPHYKALDISNQNIFLPALFALQTVS